jgi:DNA (cytosine-5)-methyltransferase 1
LNELALFAGAGGGILGGHLLGWRTVCAVEWEPYAASVLVARQNDGILPPFPIWDDVQTFDGRPWRGIVDVISGGFPCQDISAAGKGAGIDGERSGMWREMARVIHEVRPRFVFVENSPMLTSRGLGRVLGDLAQMGFDARWGVLGAADVGAPHQRDRIWIKGKMAYTKKLLGNGGNDNPRISMGGEQISEFRNSCWSENVAHAMRDRLQGVRQDGGTTGSSGLRGREGSDKEQNIYMAYAEHNGDGWWEQQPQGFKETDVANSNSLDDALRGNGKNYEESLGSRGDEPRGGLSDSGERCEEISGKSKGLANTENQGDVRWNGQLGVVEEEHHHRGGSADGRGKWWEAEPNVGRVVDGLASRVDRLKAIGNGQVPEVARTAWEKLNG